METFIVRLTVIRRSFFGFRSRVENKTVELESLDIIQATALARLYYGSEVSDVVPKTLDLTS